MQLALLILIPLIAGPAVALVGARLGRRTAAWGSGLVLAAAALQALLLAPQVFDGEPHRSHQAWLPQIGMDLSLRMDGLSLLFVLLILFVGLLVVLYASYYLEEDDRLGRFFALLLVFAAAMLGIVLADNLLLMVVFWELTSVTSFLLIGYWGDRVAARRGARMAIAITGAGGLALLAGFLLLGHIGGSYEISELNARGDAIRAHPLYTTALLLILGGAFTKSAQFPFHFWLPQAMAAPTPVSAYLHSATMVKAGVFLIARLYPALGESMLFEYLVAGVGLVTMVFGAYAAIFRHDLKGLLAYSTISHLGLIVFLLGLNSPLSSLAAVFHIVNHATFKASLFMAAGVIDHEAGTRDLRRLGGLWKAMPQTAVLATVAAAAMAGVPLLNGFLSKELFFAEALELGRLGFPGAIAPFAVVAGGAFSVAYSLRFIHDIFFNGEPRDLPRVPHEPPRWMQVPIAVLVGLCVLVGLLPGLTVGPIVQLAGQAVYGRALPPHEIAIFHGFNLPLAMSAAAMALGGLMYWLLQRRFDLHLHAPRGWNASLLFTHALAALHRLGRAATRRVENGSAQRSVLLLFVAVVVAGAAPLLGSPLPVGPVRQDANLLAAVLWLVLACAALGTVWFHRRRLLAVVLVAAAGLVLTIGFVYFSAPDLALTQVSVEVVTTVLLLMALALLPRDSPRESSPARRGRDALIAVGGGMGVAVLAWSVMTRPLKDFSSFFIEKAPTEGGGTNVVNVILVDFRGFDTLGEIVVLGIAALGVAALLKGMRLERPATAAGGAPHSRDHHPLMFSTASNVLLPLMLLVAAYIFLRGHNLPGGGFIAGLVTSIAIISQHMSDGFLVTERRLGIDFGRVVGVGIAVAALTGTGAWFFGYPFLTSAYSHPVLPVLGELPLATAIAFDVGVFLVVVGATLLGLSALARASGRSGDPS